MYWKTALAVAPALFLIAAPAARAFDMAHIDERWAGFQVGNGGGAVTIKAWENDGGPSLKLVLGEFILQVEIGKGNAAIGTTGPEGEIWDPIPFNGEDPEAKFRNLVSHHLLRVWHNPDVSAAYGKLWPFLEANLNPALVDPSLEARMSAGDRQREKALRELLKADERGLGLGSLVGLMTFFTTFRDAGPSAFQGPYQGADEVRDLDLWLYLDWKSKGTMLDGKDSRFGRFPHTRRTLPTGLLPLYGHQHAAESASSSSSSSSSSSAQAPSLPPPTGLPTGNLVLPGPSLSTVSGLFPDTESKAVSEALVPAPSTPAKAEAPKMHWPPWETSPIFRSLLKASPVRTGATPSPFGSGAAAPSTPVSRWQIGMPPVTPLAQPDFGTALPAPEDSPVPIRLQLEMSHSVVDLTLEALPAPDNVPLLAAPEAAATDL
jgi:hypothetical protein